MGKFFRDLKRGLKDIIAHQKGKLVLRIETIEVPESPVSATESCPAARTPTEKINTEFVGDN